MVSTTSKPDRKVGSQTNTQLSGGLLVDDKKGELLLRECSSDQSYSDIVLNASKQSETGVDEDILRHHLHLGPLRIDCVLQIEEAEWLPRVPSIVGN